MPDLPTRAKRERELAAAILVLFRAHRDDWRDDAFRQRLADLFRERLAGVYGDAARHMAAAERWGFDLGHVDVLADSWADRTSLGLAGDIVTSTVKKLAAGIDPDAVFSAERAGSIAATETTRAVSAGELGILALAAELLDGEDGRRDRVWRTSEDGAVCPVCAPLNRKSEDSWRHAFPDGPPAHPNCRCFLQYRKRP